MGMAYPNSGDNYVFGILEIITVFFPLAQHAGFKFELTGLNIEET
jgi:hypothetical protein